MWIQSIKVKNFKSLVDFKLDLAKFTCLIGLNGSGKSTVLHFLDFLAQLMRGDFESWLEERHWKAGDLLSKFGAGRRIEFEVRLQGEGGSADEWSWRAVFEVGKGRTIREAVVTPNMKFELEKGALVFEGMDPDWQRADDGKFNYNALFSYQGSILSQLDESILRGGRDQDFPGSLLEFKRFVSNIHSLDLLSPELLKQPSRQSGGSLGAGGQRLSAFLYELKPGRREDILVALKRVYPQVLDIDSTPVKSGRKHLDLKESFGGRVLTTEARHVNDGMLRWIAILAELQGESSVAVFDEIENGINPELVEFLIDELTTADKQVVVTTHSPMILNYLSDDVAKGSVMYLYRTDAGATEAVPFFGIPSLAEKLTVMGPGEAFVDTNLTRLRDEIARMPRSEAQADVLPAQRRRGH
jgi:predicted ATPase